ncbi:flippase [Thiothrix subterranea]|uniref:flippase n=1 Tax=Thiothrix subterranea TaxID=2735563 RepID=UPI0027E1732B|nr:flippase [Thiothrix subterranea]
MKYFKNTSWLFAEKILRMVVGFSVGIWVARYLGPEQFGLFSYAQSFVGLFSAIATLGLDGIVVRELVRDENKQDELISTTFWLKLIGAFSLLAILAIAVNFTSNDAYTNTLVFIIASATIFQCFNVIDIYFQAKIMGKYIVYANVISLFLSSIIKIILILYNAPLIAFVWTTLFDSLIIALGYIYFFSKISTVKTIFGSAKKDTTVSLLKDSWLMMVAGAAILIYMKIDQVMIQEMLGSEQVGQYAAAVRISEAWYFIPMVVASSLFPAVINAKKQSEALYYARLQRLYDLMVWMAIAVALPMTFFSDFVIQTLYGEQYNQAGNVLMIHVWAGVFVFLSVANDKWFYIENKAGLLAIKVTMGAISNIILNYMLIPKYGINGAAIATIISYSISVLWSDVAMQSIRFLLVMKLKSIFLVNSIRKIK